MHARRIILVMILLMASASSNADPTTDRIARTHVVNIGFDVGEQPFSDATGSADPSGYAIDLCKRVVDGISPKKKSISIHWVQIDDTTRFTFLDSGKIDLLCSDTTNTRERQQRYAFSYSYFIASVRIMVHSDSKFSDFRDLRGKKVVVDGDTTGEKLAHDLSLQQGLSFSFVTAKDFDEAWQDFDSGLAAAIAYDDIILSQRAGTSNKFKFLPQPLSVEPYAVMLRKDDHDLLNEVDRELATIFGDGSIQAIYNKWFVNSERNIPISPQLRESLNFPNSSPSFP